MCLNFKTSVALNSHEMKDIMQPCDLLLSIIFLILRFLKIYSAEMFTRYIIFIQVEYISNKNPFNIYIFNKYIYWIENHRQVFKIVINSKMSNNSF